MVILQFQNILVNIYDNSNDHSNQSELTDLSNSFISEGAKIDWDHWRRLLLDQL